MKRAYIIFIIFLICFQTAASQNQTDKIAAFRTEVLPQFNSFFSSAEMNESGQLLLSATEKYFSLPADQRKSVMDDIIKFWKESLVIVGYDSANELWAWDSESKKALKLDNWNVNSSSFARPTASSVSKSAMHPWFIYLGGQAQYTSDKQFSAAFNSRIGFYLLRDRWDFAWTMSFGLTGVDTMDLNYNLSYGVMSKYYFPLKKIRLSPNVGVDLGNRVYGTDEDSYNTAYFSALAGVSWFVGRGSLDLEFRVGKEFSTLIGYTFYPRFGSGKQRK